MIEDMNVIMGDSTWLNSFKVGFSKKEVCEQATLEANHESQLRKLLED